MGFKDIKYDIPVYQMLNTQIHKYANTFTYYIYTLYLHITFTNYINSLHVHICAMFLKSMEFKDIKYDIPVYQM